MVQTRLGDTPENVKVFTAIPMLIGFLNRFDDDRFSNETHFIYEGHIIESVSLANQVIVLARIMKFSKNQAYVKLELNDGSGGLEALDSKLPDSDTSSHFKEIKLQLEHKYYFITLGLRANEGRVYLVEGIKELTLSNKLTEHMALFLFTIKNLKNRKKADPASIRPKQNDKQVISSTPMKPLSEIKQLLSEDDQVLALLQNYSQQERTNRFKFSEAERALCQLFGAERAGMLLERAAEDGQITISTHGGNKIVELV